MEFGIFNSICMTPRRSVKEYGADAEHLRLRDEIASMSRRQTRPDSSTPGSPSTTSWRSTRTCRPLSPSSPTPWPRPATSTSVPGYSTSPRPSTTRPGSQNGYRLDHLSEGSFEFGPGRGSSTTEQRGFGIEDPELTRGDGRRDPAADRPDVAGRGLLVRGRPFSMPTRNVLPKPYSKPHPPIWVAAGSPSTFELAAEPASGSCASDSRSRTSRPANSAVQEGDRDCRTGRRLRQQQHDGHDPDVCLEDGARARNVFLELTPITTSASCSGTSTPSRAHRASPSGLRSSPPWTRPPSISPSRRE